MPHPCYFFFKAEDGIRSTSVIGVQTCPLPISPLGARRAARLTTVNSAPAPSAQRGARRTCAHATRHWRRTRSEERRVGKESIAPRCADDYAIAKGTTVATMREYLLPAQQSDPT